MGKRLIIAEKPSVGRDIANVLGCRENGEGCRIGKDDIVTWAVGHLVGLCYPDEMDERYTDWKVEDLLLNGDRHQCEDEVIHCEWWHVLKGGNIAMKNCPNCKELIGDNVSVCFNCGWNFDDPTQNVIAAEKERKKKEAKLKREEAENEANKVRLGRIANLNKKYEYCTCVVYDKDTGSADIDQINAYIQRYAEDRWRVHSIFTNEIGKRSSSSGYGGISSGTNATIDETIILFERVVSD